MVFGSIEYRIQAAIRPNLGGRREEDASLFVSKPSPQLGSSTSDFRMLGLTPLIRFPASSDETQVHLRDVVVLKRQKETGRCKSEVFTGCIDAKLAELRDNGNPEGNIPDGASIRKSKRRDILPLGRGLRVSSSE
jgi:hypothetical protein